MGVFFQVGDPYPLFGNDMFVRKKLWFILHFRTLETFIVGGSPMLKTVKNGNGIRVDPPLQICVYNNDDDLQEASSFLHSLHDPLTN